MTSTKKKIKLNLTLRPIKLELPKKFTGEPLFRLLENTKLGKPWIIAGAIVLVGIVFDVLMGIVWGNWQSRPEVVGVFDIRNIPALIMSLIVEPGVWAFFFGFPPALYDLFQSFQSKGIFLTNQEEIQGQVNDLKDFEGNWIFRIAALLSAIGIAWYCMFLIQTYQPAPWFSTGDYYWIRFIRIVASAYVTVYSAVWSLLALITLYRVFSTARVKVSPYDGDNAGGLRFVGGFILAVSRLALIVVPFLVAETLFAVQIGRGLWGQVNLWLELIFLPILLGVMVFLPLTACRRAMITARSEFINPIRDKILNQISQTKEGGQVSKDQLEEISSLIDFQTKLRKDFPIWPFDISMVQQIGVSFLLSILPIIISLFIR